MAVLRDWLAAAIQRDARFPLQLGFVDTQTLLVYAGPGQGELMSCMRAKGMMRDKHVEQETKITFSYILARSKQQTNKDISASHSRVTSLAEEGLVEWYEPGCTWEKKKLIRPTVFGEGQFPCKYSVFGEA